MYEPNEEYTFNPNPEPSREEKKPRRRGLRLTALVLAVLLVAGAAGGAAGYVYGRRSLPTEQTRMAALPAEPGADNGQQPELPADGQMPEFPDNGQKPARPEDGRLSERPDDGQMTDRSGDEEQKDFTRKAATTALQGGELELAPAHSELLTPADVYEQNVDAVVAINTEGTTNVWGQMTNFAASGSGFVLSADGYVATNHHVIANADRITVTMTSGDQYEAELVGSDEENDIALLKINAQNLQVASVGDSDQLRVGAQVAAIGNPLGELTNTLTVGYVSARDRVINTDGKPINMLQTDAAINNGNSGGPLFDMYGNVVGITSAKYASSSIEGLGFAIPINDAMYIIYDLLEYGYVTSRPLMGVSVRDLDSVTASYYSLPVGVYVGEVNEGGAAERAGIQAGDIIVALDDREVTCYNDLSAALRFYHAGDSAVVKVYRAGAELTMTITFDEKLPEEAAEQPEQPASIPAPAFGAPGANH